MKKKLPPKPPLSRLIIEGALFVSVAFCPNCHSSAVKKPWLIGKRYCINPKCKYYKEPIKYKL